MKLIKDLQLGFTDAENYRKRENRELFNSIFVKNIYLDQILSSNTYFLIGEKGTGKTAYAVFLELNDYKNTVSAIKYLRETDYKKFISLKEHEHLQLSDYVSIWRVVLLLLLSQSVKSDEINANPISSQIRIKSLRQAIDEYYANAFSPEIINVLTLVENSKITAELIAKYISVSAEKGTGTTFHKSRFQVNLLYIEKQFKEALSKLKLKENHILFIDGIDIRPGNIPYTEYLDCVKGLAEAIWELNNDFLAQIKGSKGRFRAVMLLRPDIFSSIGLQNSANKIKDNAVMLNWRTTYPNYRNSNIFTLADTLLSAQQDIDLEIGGAWDYYFPWKSRSTNRSREYDPSFIGFLRVSYSRPRDLVSMLQIMQEEYIEKRKVDGEAFTESHFLSYEFQNKYSEYLMGGIKDQLAFYYNSEDYELFLSFFSYLNGKAEFTYDEYVQTFTPFIEHVKKNTEKLPQFIDTEDKFLQFLYDTNIICYIEDAEEATFFRWCYREREYSNISPKVKTNRRYQIHYGLFKALNVGFQKYRH